jgi:TetR/AcrR family transcriptional regulator, transcriptional repressor for nem operon
MARTVKEEEYAVKRKEILDAAQRLVYTKGYEQMSIQDILNELKISKGAFYHYFESKNDLLEALVDQMLLEAEPVVRPIVDDPNLTALEKLHRLFDASARWKSARKDYILSLVRVWYADENAIVRQKIQTNSIRWTTPLIEKIVQQGVHEGMFHTAFPAQTGELVMYLLYHIGDAMVEMIFSSESKDIELVHAEKMMAASNEALERVLGAPTGSLNLVDRENLKVWFV